MIVRLKPLNRSAFSRRNHHAIPAVHSPSASLLPMTGGVSTNNATSSTTPPPRFKRTSSTRRCRTRTKAVRAVQLIKTAGGDEKAAEDVPRGLPLLLPQLGPILPRNFFEIDSLELAPRLLGKYLRRDDVVLQITEKSRVCFSDRTVGISCRTDLKVEAYRPNDSACHGRVGVTPRTAPLFGPGGHAYVYLCYGIHMMLNVVADQEGVGAAVLIRSCAPIDGLEAIQERRGQKTDKPILLTGPGKVGQALGLSTDWSHHPLYMSGGLEILDGPEPGNILIGPRVGIDYALPEHVSAPWRFAIADTPWISAPKNTLRPQ